MADACADRAAGVACAKKTVEFTSLIFGLFEDASPAWVHECGHASCRPTEQEKTYLFTR
jgi:hypothetical protein